MADVYHNLRPKSALALDGHWCRGAPDWRRKSAISARRVARLLTMMLPVSERRGPFAVVSLLPLLFDPRPDFALCHSGQCRMVNLEPFDGLIP